MMDVGGLLYQMDIERYHIFLAWYGIIIAYASRIREQFSENLARLSGQTSCTPITPELGR